MRLTAIVLLTVACGTSDRPTLATKPVVGAVPERAGAEPQSPTAAGSKGTVEQLSATSGDGARAAATVTTYVRALVGHDWATVCATRLRGEREEVARLSGTCERGMAGMFANQPVAIFATVTVGGIRRRGDTIAVDLVQPG